MKITYLDGRPDEVVTEAHYLVTVDGTDWKTDARWTMTMDLTQMCKDAGKKVKHKYVNGEEFHGVDLPATRFKKALKLIRRFCDYDKVQEVQQYLDDNFPKWAQEFRKLG